MFDRLTYPVMITLTIPNMGTIRKHDLTLMRRNVRKVLKQNEPWIRGGVYSLETTYNRAQKTWHLHCHILADVCSPLPSKKEKTTLAGERVCSFTAIKLKLEFDWLRLWGTGWGKKPRKDADPMKKNGETFTFESWVRQGREMSLKERRGGSFQPVEGISESERARRTEWNRANRRVVDVRPVTNRDGAAREVLKYITKCADFSDLPEAVEPFMNAVKGARLIQTFGTWYGVNLDTSTDFDPENFEDWGEMKCTCGRNDWQRMGVFYRDDVEMDVSGRWHLNAHIAHTCGGTVPRPTIRALEAREE
jgi:hypothetical protein